MTASSDPRRLVIRSMWLAGSLCAAKLATGAFTGSLSILASALDSLMDLCSSAVNFVSIAIARSPADDEHQYGHGKAEALASLFQGSFIALGGVWFLIESVRRLLHPAPPHDEFLGVAVMGVAMIATLIHGLALRKAAKAEDSNVLSAEGAHFLSDVASNIGIMAALTLARFTGKPWWDPAITAAVVAYVLWLAVPIILTAVSELMDEGLPPHLREEIGRIIREHHPSVVGYHNFRSRRAGNRRYIEFHLELRDVREFVAAHEITEELVDKIKTAVPDADVLIHADPEGGR
ncbi:MAG: cation transporter [Elusimicrobia bacterium]|nr:cation transporter [Elusimicrobiota bacterium]